MAINRIKTGGITDGTIQSGDIHNIKFSLPMLVHQLQLMVTQLL